MNSSFRKKTLAVIVICLMVLMSLPMVMADGNQKEIRDNIVETDSYNGETHTSFATVAMNSEPILKVNIPAWLGLFQIHLKVQNIGNATAHNVTLSSTSFEGKVLYNNRTFIITETLEPGNTAYIYAGQISSPYLGFGMFTLTITVTCDEGVSDTTSANGVAFGPFCYMP
jgi:hypothetical protein